MQKERLKHRGARIGSMRHFLKIHARSIATPIFGSIDFGENFTGVEEWASIRTTNGKIVMNDVGDDVNVTHEIVIRFNGSVTSETYAQTSDGRRFKILTVEDYDERGDYLQLMATDRGLGEAAKA